MPQLCEPFDPHPARDASLRSMEAVEAADREGWLGLFAADAVVEDPIGESPLVRYSVCFTARTRGSLTASRMNRSVDAVKES